MFFLSLSPCHTFCGNSLCGHAVLFHAAFQHLHRVSHYQSTKFDKKQQLALGNLGNGLVNKVKHGSLQC